MELQKQKLVELPAYKKLRGKDREGKPLFIRVDTRLQKVFDRASKRNKEKNWDYVCVVAGYCGVGKSVFAQSAAKYFDESFDETRICFSADEFIEVTNNVPEFSAVILDESFQSLNTRVTMSPDFLKIVNHMQIIRQRHLFIFLCLPNFFDLSKNIAIFRTNHLFVCYSDDEGNRGKVLGFGKAEKKRLYIIGGKYLDYGRVHANIVARFWKDEVIPEKIYNKLKFEHLRDTERIKLHQKGMLSRAKLLYYFKHVKNFSTKELSRICGLKTNTITETIKMLLDGEGIDIPRGEIPLLRAQKSSNQLDLAN